MRSPQIRRTDMADDVDELIKLRKRFDAHIEEHRIDAVEYAERLARQDLAHEKNMEAIAELTSATKQVVEAWKVAIGLGKLVKFFASFLPILLFLVWAASKLPEGFFKVG